MHSHTKLDKQPYVSLDKVVPPNQLGRDVLFSVSLGFQKFKTGPRDLSHNGCDVLNMTLHVPGTVPAASHAFAPLIPPTSCEDGRWRPVHRVNCMQDAPLCTWLAESGWRSFPC